MVHVPEPMSDLGETKIDKGVALGTAVVKGAVGAVPLAGSFISELIGVLVPNQRSGRIELYAEKLNQRLAKLEASSLSTGQIDLFEEGARQAVRALSIDRISKIAGVVAHGLASSDVEALKAKRLLMLLGEIDDDQFVILKGQYLKNQPEGPDFAAEHAGVLQRKVLTGKDRTADVDDWSDENLTYRSLVRMGLLDAIPIPREPTHGARIMIGVIRDYDITPLGCFLVRKVDQYG